MRNESWKGGVMGLTSEESEIWNNSRFYLKNRVLEIQMQNPPHPPKTHMHESIPQERHKAISFSKCPSFKTVHWLRAIAQNKLLRIGINPAYKISRVKMISVSKMERGGVVPREAEFPPGLEARDTFPPRGCSFPRAAYTQRASFLSVHSHATRYCTGQS